MKKHSFFAFLCAVIVTISACHKDNEPIIAPTPIVTDTLPVIVEPTGDPRDAFVGTYTGFVTTHSEDNSGNYGGTQSPYITVILKGTNEHQLLMPWNNDTLTLNLNGAKFTIENLDMYDPGASGSGSFGSDSLYLGIHFTNSFSIENYSWWQRVFLEVTGTK